jgi:hypothetical protein
MSEEKNKTKCCKATARFIKATHWPVISRWVCSKRLQHVEKPKEAACKES